ncbi:hypothetical protein ACWCPQ_25185 [Nocardia sp. NPDC001965]
MSTRLPAHAVAGWKLRLLDRIHDHYADQATSTAEDGAPGPTTGRSPADRPHDPATTYTGIAVGRELETRAAAAGLSEAAIDSARAAGCAQRQTRADGPGEMMSSGPSSTGPMDVLADQVWRLRHMALVLAEYDIRSSDHDIRENFTTITKLSHNMDALWASVTDDIASAGLDIDQAKDLWSLDERGWRHCATLIHDYDDTELHARLHGYAALELGEHLPATGRADRILQALRAATAPPRPVPLSEAATEALLTLRSSTESHHHPVWTDHPEPAPGQERPTTTPDPEAEPDL